MSDSREREFPLSEVSPEDTRTELSCSVAKMPLLYLAEAYGAHVADDVVYSTRMNRTYLSDSSNWVSLLYYYRLLQRMVEVTGDPDAPFKAGRFVVNPSCFGWLASLVVRFESTGLIYAQFSRQNQHYCRPVTWEFAMTGPHSCTLSVSSHIPQDRNNCRCLQGAMASLPTLRGSPPATVRHPECICDGHPACVYELSWVDNPTHIRALAGGTIGGVVGLGVAAYYGWEGLGSALGYAVMMIGYLIGGRVGSAAHLREIYAYTEEQSTSLDTAMKTTTRLNEELQEKIEERTEALRVANEDLKKAYNDLEDSRARELQSQRTATIGILASGMAHELNTPLNTIQLAIQGLNQHPDSEREQAELLRNAKRAALRCSRIVGELLAFSREPQTISTMRLGEVLDSALSVFEAEMPEGIAVVREFESPCPVAHVDGAQIQQALLNLLNNASDAVEARGMITVRLRTRDEAAVIEVADNGPGIPEDRLKHIFEPFESTKRDRGAGLGLGLSISSELIQKNGGTIRASNRPEGGACFILSFPLASDDEGLTVAGLPSGPALPILTGITDSHETARQEASPEKRTFSPDALRVLLIEDDVEAGRTLKQVLANEDLQVACVTSGKEGISAFDARRFDAVVTDVLLGDMTGVDVLRAIRQQDDDFPVILLTGHDSIGSAIEALRLGAQDYIQKPLERIEDLTVPIWKAVGHHRLVRESEQLTQELRVSEKRFRSFAELLPETVFEADGDGRVTLLNQAGMERFGVTEAMLHDGFFITQGVPPQEEARVRDVLERVLGGESVSGEEFTGMHQAGKAFPILAFCAPIRSNGNVAGVRAIVVDITNQKQAEREVLHFQEVLREMNSQLQLTEERERYNLASDLHDSVAQLLAAANLRLALVERKVEDPELQSHVAEVGQILTESIAQTRSLVFQLSPPTLHTEGFVSALEDLACQMQPLHDLRVRCALASIPLQLDEKATVHVFRAVRELLVNVAKHAGVSECSLSMAQQDGWICVTVEDKGCGFELPPAGRGPTLDGFGLFGIRERLHSIGGQLTIESEPGNGTKATISVPAPTPPA